MGNSHNKASSLRKSQSVPDTQKLAGDAAVFDKQKSVSHMRLNHAQDKPPKPGKAGKKNKLQDEELPQLNRAESTFLPEFPLRGDLEELEYDVLDVIARGAFGNVIKVQVDDQKKFYAVKVLDKAQIIEEGAIRQCKDEATIQSMAGQHPFVVQAYEYWQSKRSLYIVLDYVPHGDMFTLWTFHGAFPESLVQLYIAEMAMVVDFLHNASVIYRDIKMENILFNAKGHIQLTDFGLAKWLQGGDQTRTVCGTLQYMAPEVLAVYPYSHSADWWSLGILMYAMLAGRYPVDGVDTHTKMAQKVFECDFFLPSHISDSAQDVINRVLTKSPHKRLCDVNSLQDLEFFQGIFFSDLIEQKLNPLDVVPEDFFPMTGNSWAPQDLTDEEQGHFDQFDDSNNTLTDEPGYTEYRVNSLRSHHHPEPVQRLQPSLLYSQQLLNENKQQYSPLGKPKFSKQPPQEDKSQYSIQVEPNSRQQLPMANGRQYSPHSEPQPHEQPYNLQARPLTHGKSLPDFLAASLCHDTGLDARVDPISFARDDMRFGGPTSDYKDLEAGGTEARRDSMRQSFGTEARRDSMLQASGTEARRDSMRQSFGTEARRDSMLQASGTEARRDSVLQSGGSDTRLNSMPQPADIGRSNDVSGNHGQSNVVPQSGYDVETNVLQSAFDGRRNFVPQSGSNGRSNIIPGKDGRSNVVPGNDGRSSVVPGNVGRSNVVPGNDGRSSVVPGSDGRIKVVPRYGYDGNVVPQSGFVGGSNGVSGNDGKINVIPHSGYVGNVPNSGYIGNVPQSGYGGRGNVVPQSGYNGRSSFVHQDSFGAQGKEICDTRATIDTQRNSTNQDRGSYVDSSNNQSGGNNATRTNYEPGHSSMSSAQTFNNINGSAGSTNRLSSGPEYKLVEAAPTVTLKTAAPLSSSHTRYNPTAPGYNSQTSMGHSTPSGYTQRNSVGNKPAVGLSSPAHETDYGTQVSPNYKVNHQTTGPTVPSANIHLDHTYKTLEAPPTVIVPSAHTRFSQNPGFLQSRDLQQPPPTTTTSFPNNFSSSSTSAAYTTPNYHRLEYTSATIGTAAPQRNSAQSKPAPPQKPTVGPKPAVPVKPIPAPRQTLRADHTNEAHSTPEAQASLNHNQSPGFPHFTNQRPFTSVSHPGQQTNPRPQNISTGFSGDYQGWNSQVQPAAELSRIRSASMNNMLSSDRLDSDRLDSDRPNSSIRSPSIDDENFQWKLPEGTTPSFV